MKKLLNGKDLADYIKQRQAKDVRSLIQAFNKHPKLAIIQAIDDPAINIYVKLKKLYGSEIGIQVDIHKVEQSKIESLIKQLNKDDSVNGIIIQLPIEDNTKTEELINLVAGEKDVDALSKETHFDSATPTAILWLLAGYNVSLKDKKVLLIGRGKLVGAPLEKMLKTSDIDLIVADRKTEDLKSLCLGSDIIITATGKPRLITANMIKPGTVIIDAGTASEDGGLVGDLSDDVYRIDNITLTPKKGGVGPLTVCVLFENVIKAVKMSI
jgi:methylenetetrahydrofolate dehydrogenase (NADP+)/methenyltetrahydrofolate cyclohydrolase